MLFTEFEVRPDADCETEQKQGKVIESDAINFLM
jgi:hypothetical protein